MIKEDTRCGPNGPRSDWSLALVNYWMARRRGKRTMREARATNARHMKHGRHRRREVMQ